MCDPGEERLRPFTVLTDHQWSAGPHLQLRLQCSWERDKKGDRDKKRRSKLEMENSCTESEAQTQQKIYHRAVLWGQHHPNKPKQTCILPLQITWKLKSSTENLQQMGTSHIPVSLFINVNFLRLNQLRSHKLLPFQLQSRLLSHGKKILTLLISQLILLHGFSQKCGGFSPSSSLQTDEIIFNSSYTAFVQTPCTSLFCS